jgi:hypothetical protein
MIILLHCITIIHVSNAWRLGDRIGMAVFYGIGVRSGGRLVAFIY